MSSPKPAAFAKRLFHIKEGLQELDYEDENTEFSVKCMLRAAMYPPFLRVAEGKKLVGEPGSPACLRALSHWHNVSTLADISENWVPPAVTEVMVVPHTPHTLARSILLPTV